MLEHKEFTRSPKSFVLRNNRITKAQKRALNELSKNYTLSVESDPLDFTKAFIDHLGKKLIADVGFGSGESVLYMAEDNHEENFIGIEVFKSGIGNVLNQIKQRGISNLKIIHHDVETLFEGFIPNETFDCITFLYPDPWPKRKHHKRRLLGDKFLKLANKKLKKGGFLYFKTDWEDYFLKVEKILTSQEGWLKENEKNVPAIFCSLRKTNYEEKAIKEGRRSFKLFYSKN